METMEKEQETEVVKAQSEEQEILQKAADIVQKNKQERGQAFQQELQALCEKYQIQLVPQITITAV